mgnify:CR=1 FL=1
MRQLHPDHRHSEKPPGHRKDQSQGVWQSQNLSTQIEQLTKRITAIRESESENGDFQARLKEIQDIIDKRRENKDIYDDSIVRQMVECIKVYHDGRLQIILGGGYELEEYLEK